MTRLRLIAGVLCLGAMAVGVADAQTQRAAGTFDVKIGTLPLADSAAGATLGRMSIDKQYHGALEGTGKGEMLTAGSAVEGSGAYVAIERVAGKLDGRSGTFVLQHSGVMAHGSQQLSVTVAPDSGTGELTGIAGKMNIVIEGGKHSYTFEYTLPAKR
jgi:hypothetical protein